VRFTQIEQKMPAKLSNSVSVMKRILQTKGDFTAIMNNDSRSLRHGKVLVLVRDLSETIIGLLALIAFKPIVQ